MSKMPDESTPPRSTEAREKLERAVEQVQTPEKAEQTLQRAEAELQTGRSAPSDGPARTLAGVAKGAVREGSEDAPLNRAVEQTTSGQRQAPKNARQRRGLGLLRGALFKRLGPLPALDLRAFLAINHLPHPKWADRIFGRLSWALTGGFGWLPILLLSFLLAGKRRPPFWRTVLEIVPALWLATSTVEYPIKAVFRRRRPFVKSVEAIVVGRKPGSWSFPSGHSATAFAGAVLLSRCFPQGRRIFFFIAVATAFSRTYLGAHYPGDVLTGSLAGAGLARGYRALLQAVFAR